MAIREYVGARYVPRFLGLYDNTQQYDALDVVDNGLGTSYIAKKTVPPGTALTNTDYWFVYGASSGAIINLQNQIGDLSSLDTTDKDNLVEAINETVAEIDDLQQMIAHRRIVFVGDSYAQGYSPDGDTDPWPLSVAYNLGVSASDYTIEAYGNTGFARTNSGINFRTLLSSSSISDPETVTDVIVAGGYNDTGESDADIRSGIADFASIAKTKYPNAKVHIGFIGKGKAVDRLTFAKKCNVYNIAALTYGCRFMINAQYALCDYFNCFSSDGFHPNQSGQYAIADAITQCVLNGIANITKDYTTFSLTSGICTVAPKRANALGQCFKNGFVSIQALSKIDVTFTSPYNYGLANGNTAVNIGTVDGGFIIGSTYEAPSIDVQCMCQTGAAEFITCAGTLTFNQGHIDLRLQSTLDNNTNWRNISTLYGLEITRFEKTINADFA